MDLKEYIASGILENYVLGTLSQQEAAQVENMAAAHPSIGQELEALRTSIEEYALQYEQQPPTELKSRIMQALGISDFGLPSADLSSQRFNSNVKPLTPKSEIRNPQSALKIAASIALFISLLGNLLFYSRWQKTEARLALAESQNVQIASELKVTQANYVAVNQEIKLIDNPTYQKIKVAGTPDSPTLKAVVYWNKSKLEVYLSGLSQLPSLPEGKQYQLWAIVDGKPVDAGLITTSDSLQQFKPFANAQAFAISMEAKGGSTTAKGPLGPVVGVGKV